MYAGDSVFKHHQLVDLAELFEHRTQVVFVQIARDLTDEQFDGVRVLVRGHSRSGGAPRHLDGRRCRIVGDGSCGSELLRLVMATGGDGRTLLNVQHVERLVRRVGHLTTCTCARAHTHTHARTYSRLVLSGDSP